MPADAKRLRVDSSQFTVEKESFGIGGISHDHETDAFVTLAEPNVIVYAWKVKLRVMGLNPGTAQAPSLLGRDVLRHTRFVYEPSANRLELEVKHSDAQKDLCAPMPPSADAANTPSTGATPGEPPPRE